MTDFVILSLVPLTVAILAAVACALPGNLLLLRRQAMVGDALSHVVLPGIVAGFLLSGRTDTLPMMIGAGAAALISVALVEAITRFGRVEPGAAMGTVFTAMFAAGVLMLERSGAGTVHLDVEHALYGNLEALIWLDGVAGWPALADPAARATLPPEVRRLAATAAAIALTMATLWRPLKIATFDETFARTVGVPVRALSLLVIVLAAMACVAAFTAVGSILVIAMLICPAATARLLTDHLERQIGLSLLIATATAAAGFGLADAVPRAFGLDFAVSAAGMIAALSGAVLALAALAGPRRRPVKP